MKPINFLFLIPAIILLSACNGDCIKGEGEADRRMVEIAPFDGIVVEGPIEVRLRRSDTQHVDIEAQPNIRELLETEVREGTWFIRTSQCYNSNKDMIVYVDLPMLRSISIQGSGDVISEDQFDGEDITLEIAGSGDLEVIVNARKVNASIKGSGDMEIVGMCQQFIASINGSGDLQAGDLQSAQAKAEIIGSGDINLHVTDALEATVTGSGNIRYKGSPPNVNKNVTGSGDISER